MPSSPVAVPIDAPSDRFIRGAAAINPVYAGDFIASRYFIQHPVPGDHEPAVPRSKVADQTVASPQSPNFWKSKPANPMSNQMRFGHGAPDPEFKYPWIKKFIPPLALFNDASQWVNVLSFNHPLPRWGFNSSIFPLFAQYFTPKPINTYNLAAGNLNLQLQLGTVAIQATQLTTDASNYFGGS